MIYDLEEVACDIRVIRKVLHDLIEEANYNLLDTYIQSLSKILNSNIVDYHRIQCKN